MNIEQLNKANQEIERLKGKIKNLLKSIVLITEDSIKVADENVKLKAEIKTYGELVDYDTKAILEQSDEIDKLKAQLKLMCSQHDKEMGALDETTQAMLKFNDERINKLVDGRDMLRANVNALRDSLSKNQEWVRCGIGGNCGGYPQDHKDYIAITDLLSKTPAQCLDKIKIDAVVDYIESERAAIKNVESK